MFGFTVARHVMSGNRTGSRTRFSDRLPFTAIHLPIVCRIRWLSSGITPLRCRTHVQQVFPPFETMSASFAIRSADPPMVRHVLLEAPGQFNVAGTSHFDFE